MSNPLREFVDHLASAFSGTLSFEFDPLRPEAQEVDRAISDASVVAGVIACLQPIPAADLFVLSPLYVKLTLHIGRIKGFEVTQERARELVREVLGVIWLGLTGQALIGVLAKAIPPARALLTYPLNYAATWAIGQVVAYYFDCLRLGQAPSKTRMRALFKEQLQVGRQRGQASEPAGILARAEDLRTRIEARDPLLLTRTRLKPSTTFVPPSPPQPSRAPLSGKIVIGPFREDESPADAPARPAAQATPEAGRPLAPAAGGLVAKLERLAELHARGLLDEREFSAAKARLLAQPSQPER